jgi:hypothetical protein
VRDAAADGRTTLGLNGNTRRATGSRWKTWIRVRDVRHVLRHDDEPSHRSDEQQCAKRDGHWRFYGSRSVLAGWCALALGLKLGSSGSYPVFVGDQMPACSSTLSCASDSSVCLHPAQEREHLITIAAGLLGKNGRCQAVVGAEQLLQLVPAGTTSGRLAGFARCVRACFGFWAWGLAAEPLVDGNGRLGAGAALGENVSLFVARRLVRAALSWPLSEARAASREAISSRASARRPSIDLTSCWMSGMRAS